MPRKDQLTLPLEGSSWHVTLHPHADAEGPLAGAVALFKARTDLDQRDTARVRSNLACCTSSRETASTVARSRVPRESRLVLGGNRWHVAPRPRAERERPLADAAILPAARTDNHSRGTARARSKLVCCASSRETASAVARTRVPREGQLILSLGGSSWHVALCPHAEAEGALAGAVALF